MMFEQGDGAEFHYLWDREAQKGAESGRKPRPIRIVIRTPGNTDVVQGSRLPQVRSLLYAAMLRDSRMAMIGMSVAGASSFNPRSSVAKGQAMPRTHEAEIEAFRAGLNANTLSTVDALRSLIMSIDQPLVEEFKWNAPSFRLGDEHRVTLGIERNGSVRMVLHRGVSKKDTQNFEFRDPLNLANWPAKDRGVLKLRSLQDVNSQRDSLKSLISRWLAIPG